MPPSEPKQLPRPPITVNRHVQIRRRDAHVRVPRRIADVGQQAHVGQGMADECVPALMDRQRAESLMSVIEYPARSCAGRCPPCLLRNGLTSESSGAVGNSPLIETSLGASPENFTLG